MNKSILAITTILSLGTVGCAGVVGTQVGATANPQPAASPEYAAGLGTLWEPSPERPSGLEQRVAADAVGRKSDLWTPASAAVAPSWAHDPAKNDPKATLSSTTTRLKF